MRYKKLFRVLVKVVGVCFIAAAVVGVVNNIIQMTGEYLAGGNAFPYSDGSVRWLLYQIVPEVTQLAMGLYLFFGGQWIANLAIPGNRPYCPECGYDLTNTSAAHCPECGTANTRGKDGLP